MSGHSRDTLNDLRLDYLLQKGFTPMIAYGGIPACIAADPTQNSSVSKNKTRYKGKMWITSPPKDYGLWEEICFAYTKHIVERYGEETVAGWHLHCFNEPDLPMFFMQDATVAERCEAYCRLYDGFERALLRVSDKLCIGGPALAHEMEFLDQFLAYVTKEGKRLDYVCIHNYGTSPGRAQNGIKPVCVDHQFRHFEEVSDIVRKYFPDGKELIQDEWGALSGGFVPAEQYPSVLFRETEKLAAYYTLMLTRFVREYDHVGKMLICLSGQHEMESEFEGFRNFFSLHFIKKPVYNAYVLAAKLHDRVLADCTDRADLHLLSTRDDAGRLAVLLTYAKSDFGEELPPLRERIVIRGVSGRKKVTLYIIDEEHAVPYRIFLENGSPTELSPSQLEELRRASDLHPQVFEAQADGTLAVDIALTRNGVLLLEVV